MVLIGASALGCVAGMAWRRTHDLDLSISIPQEALPGPLGERPGWVPSQFKELSWESPQGVAVDIIPAGPAELASGRLLWPRTGAGMTLAGFRHVFEQAIQVPLAPDLSIEVAPPEVITLLKMVAYLDRPQERWRDLEDISHLLEESEPRDPDDRFSPEILDSGMGYELVSAYLLGKSIGTMVDERERRLVEVFVSKVQDEDDPDLTQARMVRARPWEGEPGSLLSRMAAFDRGFKARPGLRPD